MKQDLTLLDSLIEGMDVPSLRKSDIGWLNRNLGVRNFNHPNFEKAMIEIRRLLKTMKG